MSKGVMAHRILHLYGLNKNYRDETADYYPLPLFLHCVRFAMQELTESDDVMLRIGGNYSRNNSKPDDMTRFRKELGQALCMALDSLIWYGPAQMGDVERVFRDKWSGYHHDDNWVGNAIGEGMDRYVSCFAQAMNYLAFTLITNIRRMYPIPVAVYDPIRAVAYIVFICDHFEYNPEELIHERYAQVEEKWGQNAVGKGGQEPVTSGEGAA